VLQHDVKKKPKRMRTQETRGERKQAHDEEALDKNI
jgi:hypothetical protein